jgi:hypothetical protein
LDPDFSGVILSTTPDHWEVVVPEKVFYPPPGPDFQKIQDWKAFETCGSGVFFSFTGLFISATDH